MTHEIKLQLLSNYRNLTVRNKTTASKLCVVLSSTAGNIMHNDDKLIVMQYSVEKSFHFTNSELFGDITGYHVTPTSLETSGFYCFFLSFFS